jgi:hypothetical protein
MRWLGHICGGPFIAGILISNLALVVSCVAFYRIVETEHGTDTALRAVRFLLLFPTAFILSGVFSEALFLALTLLAFYFLQRERFLLAALAGFASALTRSPGALLAVPLALQYALRCRELKQQPRPAAALLLLVPGGLVAFSVFNYALTGDMFAFARIQGSWGRAINSPVSVLLSGFSSGDVTLVFSATLTAIALVLLILGFRSIGLPYFIMAAYLILIPLSTGLVSMPRYLLVAFPIPLILAKLTEKREVESAIVVALALFQGFLMVFWVNGFKMVV